MKKDTILCLEKIRCYLLFSVVVCPIILWANPKSHKPSCQTSFAQGVEFVINVNGVNKTGQTALIQAVKEGQTEIVQALLSVRSSFTDINIAEL